MPAPKRPPTALTLFKTEQKELKRQNKLTDQTEAEMTMKAFDSHLSKKWRSMSDSDKQTYLDQHSALLSDFEEAMGDYQDVSYTANLMSVQQKWEADALKKIKTMQGLDLIKLEAKVLNLTLEKNDRIPIRSLGKKWVSMEQAERTEVYTKLKDTEYIKSLMLQVKNKKADPENMPRMASPVKNEEAPPKKEEPAPEKEAVPPKKEPVSESNKEPIPEAKKEPVPEAKKDPVPEPKKETPAPKAEEKKPIEEKKEVPKAKPTPEKKTEPAKESVPQSANNQAKSAKTPELKKAPEPKKAAEQKKAAEPKKAAESKKAAEPSKPDLSRFDTEADLSLIREKLKDKSIEKVTCYMQPEASFMMSKAGGKCFNLGSSMKSSGFDPNLAKFKTCSCHASKQIPTSATSQKSFQQTAKKASNQGGSSSVALIGVAALAVVIGGIMWQGSSSGNSKSKKN